MRLWSPFFGTGQYKARFHVDGMIASHLKTANIKAKVGVSRSAIGCRSSAGKPLAPGAFAEGERRIIRETMSFWKVISVMKTILNQKTPTKDLPW